MRQTAPRSSRQKGFRWRGSRFSICLFYILISGADDCDRKLLPVRAMRSNSAGKIMDHSVAAADNLPHTRGVEGPCDRRTSDKLTGVKGSLVFQPVNVVVSFPQELDLITVGHP